MKVVMLSRHGCFRVMKESFPLIAKGYDVHLITEKITQGSDQFKTVTSWQGGLDQLYEAIKLHKDADIFHAHNEPSWFVSAVKEMFPDKPVVLDVHDSNLVRKSDEEHQKELETDPDAFRVSTDERNNCQLADALVYVSDPMAKIVGTEFKLDQPNIVLPSYVPLCLYRLDQQFYRGGLVYEGRIDIQNELPNQWEQLFQYSNYLELAKKCREIGMDFHIYTSRENEEVRKQYGEVCFLHSPKQIDKLIKCLSSHDWGLVGNIKPHTEWANAMPNKLFEYMAGCTPVVSIHASESSKFIEENGFGITVSTMEELAERWKEHRECRKTVIKHRREWAMEQHIWKLEDLYKQVLS